jgi:WD40 repeat protein
VILYSQPFNKRDICISEIENISSSAKIDRWIRKAQLSESKGSVNDVKFAPRHQGLKLATASSDGIVRIYEVTDIFSLSYWPIQVHSKDLINTAYTTYSRFISIEGFISSRKF